MTADESARLEFLAACLTKLGLSLPSKDAWNDIPRPTSMLNLYCQAGHLVSLVNRLSDQSHAVVTEGSFLLADKFGLDAFNFEWTTDGSWSTNIEPPQSDRPTYRVNVGSKIVGRGFDYDVFHASLNDFRTIESSHLSKTWKQALGAYERCPELSWGDNLLYGETVTSTNTLLSR